MVLFFIMLPTTAHAIANCTVTASNVVFGSYNFTNSSPTEVTGNVQVSCSLIGLISLLVSYEILLDTGNSGSYIPREMNNGTDQLQYNLYTNAARTSIWGDGNSGTAKITDGYLLGLFTVVRDYPVYGTIPSGQNISAGVYTDTIIVTVNY